MPVFSYPPSIRAHAFYCGGILLASACLGLLLCGPSQAAPATQEGAAQLTTTLESLTGPIPFDKGIFKITPQGENYDLTVDFDTSKLDLPSDAPSVHLGPYVVHITPRDDGTYAFSSGPASGDFSFDVPNKGIQSSIVEKFEGCVSQGVFDPKLLFFSSLNASCDSLSASSKSPSGHVEVSSGKILVTSTGKANSAGGVDITLVESVAGFSEAVAIDDKAAQVPPFTVHVGSLLENVNATGVRTTAISDLIAFLVHNQGRALPAKHDEITAKVKAALPFWHDMTALLSGDGVSITTPKGEIKIGHVEINEGLSGVVADGRYSAGIKVSDVEVPVPPFTVRVSSAQEQVNLTGVRGDAFADLIILLANNPSAAELLARQDDIKAKVKTALPFWQDMSVLVGVDGLHVSTPNGEVKLDHFEASLGLSGMVKDARYALGMKFSGVEVPDGLLPPELKPVIATAGDFDLKLTEGNLDDVANFVIDNYHGHLKSPLPETLAPRLLAIALGGRPQVEAGLNVAAPAFDIKGQGNMPLTPALQGKARISAAGIDAITAAVNAAKSPEAHNAIFLLAMIKGLAKTSSDGRLNWDIGLDIPAKKVTVNGQAFDLPEK